MGKGFWIGTIIVVIILGITAGIIVHVYGDEKIERGTLEQVNELTKMKEASENGNSLKISSNAKYGEKSITNEIKNNNENYAIDASSSDVKTTPNTILIFESYYSKCGHSQIRSEKIKSEYVNKNQEDIQKIYSDWKIKFFSSEKIELYRDENSICDNHFVVRDMDGYVTVYNINKDGQEIIRDKTDISTKYLPKDDTDLLQNGIKANSMSELEQILADFE